MPGFHFGDGEGFQFHFGIGAFPFGIFTSFNNLGLGHGGGVNLPPGIYLVINLSYYSFDKHTLDSIKTLKKSFMVKQ